MRGLGITATALGRFALLRTKLVITATIENVVQARHRSWRMRWYKTGCTEARPNAKPT